MSSHGQYFDYLMHRSRLGEIYRKYWLYPRLSKYMIGTALDIGCGIGDMLAFRPGTVGVDVNAHTVEYCRQRGFEAHLMQPDVLPFESGKFDSVLLDNVLEHIAQPEALLQDVRRVMVLDGRLLVGVPGIRGWESDTDHKVFYDEEKLQECIERNGFTHVKTIHAPLWRSAWLAAHVRQYCIYSIFQQTH